MKLVQVAELSGATLDWAVAKASGLQFPLSDVYSPSSNESQGNAIIEREDIRVTAPTTYYIGPDRSELKADYWNAKISMPDDYSIHQKGPTRLIAAMRCFVKSKLGESVEIPDQLC